MDPDWLDGELDAWVEEDILSEDQASRIRQRYDLDARAGGAEGQDGGEETRHKRRSDIDPTGAERDATDAGSSDDTEIVDRNRIVTVLSVMGAGLVAVGIIVFLAARWDSLPRAFRAFVLAGSAAGFLASGGVLRYRRGRPRAGHVLLGVGALAIGVALFGIDDLYSIVETAAPLYAVWAGLALAVAHRVRSSPIVLIGLLPALGAVVDVVEGSVLLHVGFFGIAVYGLSLLVGRTRWATVSGAYRLGSVVGVTGSLLLVLFDDVRLDWVAPDSLPVLGAFVGAAAVGVAAATVETTRDDRSISTAVWTTTAFLVFGMTTIAATGPAESLPAVGRVLGWNGMALGLILVTVWHGYEERSRALVNWSVVAFLIQLLAILVSTVFEALGPALALVIGGLVLLGVGAGLERGRRELLTRMRLGGGV